MAKAKPPGKKSAAAALNSKTAALEDAGIRKEDAARCEGREEARRADGDDGEGQAEAGRPFQTECHGGTWFQVRRTQGGGHPQGRCRPLRGHRAGQTRSAFARNGGSGR